jgi:hypothetical protein
MSNQIVISSGAKVRSLEGVLTGTAGIVNSVPYGGANGVATLDSSGKVPLSQLPSSVITYLGTWNASTNTPTLTNGVGDDGDLYICNVAGTVNFGAGPITFAVGDWVIYGSGTWQKSAGASGTVTSVAVSRSGDALAITGSPITTSGTINIGFAGTSGQYINGAGNLTTFPSLTGFVPYTGATANVDLGSYDLTTDIVNLNQLKAVGSGGLNIYSNSGTHIALMGGGGGAGTTFYGGIIGTSASFASSGGSDTFAINHSSGSGISLNITKGGNGEGLYINKTSGSGNAATIIGTLNATTLVKNGGTSSQYLMADGSVSTGPDLTGYVPYTGATTNVDLGSRDLLTRRLYLNTNNQGIYARDSAGTNLYQIFALNSSDKVSIDQTGLGTVFGGNVDLGSYDLTGNYINGKQLTVNKNGTTGGALFIESGSAGFGFGGTSGIAIASGSTNNLTLAFTDATATNTKAAILNFGSLTNNTNRTYTLPDISGTLALLEGTQTFTGAKTFSTINVTNASTLDGNLLLKKAGIAVTTSTYVTQFAASSGVGIGYSDGTGGANFTFPTASIYTYTFPTTSGTLALSSDLSSYVPYTGATSNLNLGTNALLASTLSVLGSGTTAGYLSFTPNTNQAYSAWTSVAALGDSALAFSFSPSAGQKIFNFDVTGLTVSTMRTYTMPNASGTLVLGTGTTNYLPKFTGASTLGNSAIQDSGSLVTITSSTDILTSSGIGSSGVTGLLRVVTAGTSSGIAVGQANSSRYTSILANEFVVFNDDASIRTNGAFPLSLGTNNTGRLFITSAGNVGIGTSSPPTYSGYTVLALNNATNGGVIDFQTNGTRTATINNDTSNFNIGSITSLPFLFYTNGTERMRITSAGNVLVGGTNENPAANATNGIALRNDFLISINRNNDFGLDIGRNGTDGAVASFRRGSTQVGTISVTGSNTSYNTTSDYRLKQDLKEYNGLDLVKSIKTYDYEWKSDNSRMYGVLAHELQEVIPYAVYGEKDEVDENDEPKMQGVDYSKLVPVLVKAIQELKAEIDSLKQKS